jgi:deazaflavin-dependent oxidoreductase (nitroreductase family)
MTDSTKPADQLFGDEHVQAYRETDGERGHDWMKGSTVLLLTTEGRKSGEERTTPLIYRPYEDKHLVVASKGGADDPPDWYRNIQHDPEVGVQIRGERFRARARDATPDEKPDMWKTMTAMWPDYDDYQQKTEREIPVVVLERI